MKKLLLLIICFSTVAGFSQLSLKKLDGTAINDGDIFNFTSNTDPDNYLGLKIYNSSANVMKVKAKVVSLINTDGSDVQLCFGNVCVATIEEGISYPDNPAIIAAQGSNGNFDHFLNQSSGLDSNLNVEYVLKFYQLDNNNLETGNSVSFTYRFSPTLAVNNFTGNQNTDLVLKSNLVNNLLDIKASTNLSIAIFDTTGQLILKQIILSGNQSIDVSTFSNGLYFIKSTNDQNQQSTFKFLKT